MKKRVKKKHEHRYWLRNAKERRVTWQEFFEKITNNCPDSTRIISIVAVDGALSMWADQSINKAKDGAEIVIEEPKEEQEHDVL